MSHFTVLVVGEDADKQLAPYHEFECTGVDDQYILDIDITDEARSAHILYQSSNKGEERENESFGTWLEGWYGIHVVPVGENPDTE